MGILDKVFKCRSIEKHRCLSQSIRSKSIVNNVISSLMLGLLRKGGFVQINAGWNTCIKLQEIKGEKEKMKLVRYVLKNITFLNGRKKQIEADIVQKNVIMKQSLSPLKEKIITNISTEELKDMLNLSIFLANGETSENKFMSETITNVRSAENTAGDSKHTILTELKKSLQDLTKIKSLLYVSPVTWRFTNN